MTQQVTLWHADSQTLSMHDAASAAALTGRKCQSCAHPTREYVVISGGSARRAQAVEILNSLATPTGRTHWSQQITPHTGSRPLKPGTPGRFLAGELYDMEKQSRGRPEVLDALAGLWD